MLLLFHQFIMTKVSICWLRRDLRLDDNAALYHALKSGVPAVPVFIFDTEILDELDDQYDRRVHLIHDTLKALQVQLEKQGSTLQVLHGNPKDCFGKLMKQYEVSAVYTNHDYEPYARQRDKEIKELLAENSIEFHTYKDQVIFEKEEVVKDNGEPYHVFTPYSKKWNSLLNNFYLQSYPCKKYYSNFFQQSPKRIPSLDSLGFKETGYKTVAPKLDKDIAADYEHTRDIPSVKGTTRLSVHLRFGTMSIRQLVREVMRVNETLLNELIWREFYQMILWHYPEVVNHSFKREYDNIKWRNNEKEFERWCNGTTGYPIVDAGMRELNETGFMHNRVRMITASFLCKHLLIDWRWGEAYLAKKLLDYDLAANNGNWQWAAGTGCDAAPYFRIFNPYTQTQKFDPELKYIKQWVPELETLDYPAPLVDHAAARERCLGAYKAALSAKR